MEPVDLLTTVSTALRTTPEAQEAWGAASPRLLLRRAEYPLAGQGGGRWIYAAFELTIRVAGAEDDLQTWREAQRFKALILGSDLISSMYISDPPLSITMLGQDGDRRVAQLDFVLRVED